MTTRLTTVLVLALLALPAAATGTETQPPQQATPEAERIESPRERMMQMHRQRAREGHGTHYGMGWERRQDMGPTMMERGYRGGAPAPEERKSD